MRQDALEAISNWEKMHEDMARKHRRFGLAIVATAIFLAAVGIAVAR